MCSVFALFLMKYFPSRRLWTCHVVPIAKSQRQAGLANNLHITTATLAITANMPPSTLRSLPTVTSSSIGTQGGNVCSSWHTQAPFFRRTWHKSLCSASSICGRPVVYSAEAARYRSAMLCAPCNGEEENVLRSLAAGFGKRESAHESHMSLCDESHAS